MLHKTDAIVLRSIKYGESSLICSMYTSSAGSKSFIVSGIRSKKQSGKAFSFQPGMMLKVVYYEGKRSRLCRIKEFSPTKLYEEIPFNVKKIAIVMFLSELLYKTLNEEEKNEELFHFIRESLLLLDKTNENLTYFPSVFMIKLSGFMGFKPDGRYRDNTPVFDLSEGNFTLAIPPGSPAIRPPVSEVFSRLINTEMDKLDKLEEDTSMGKLIFQACQDFFRLHLDGFGNLKSPDILSSVFQ